MSGPLCTRLTIGGHKKDINPFLKSIDKKKINYKVLDTQSKGITIETYDYYELGDTRDITAEFRNLDFYEIVYDMHSCPNHWYLEATVTRNGEILYHHRWSSQNNPKLWRKSKKRVLEVAFEDMIENMNKK